MNNKKGVKSDKYLVLSSRKRSDLDPWIQRIRDWGVECQVETGTEFEFTDDNGRNYGRHMRIFSLYTNTCPGTIFQRGEEARSVEPGTPRRPGDVSEESIQWKSWGPEVYHGLLQ